MPRIIPQSLPFECIDPSIRSPEEIARERELEHLVSASLSGNEWRVIQFRYFTPDAKPTFMEIGRRLRLSPERVRQIEEAALQKLQPIVAR